MKSDKVIIAFPALPDTNRGQIHLDEYSAWHTYPGDGIKALIFFNPVKILMELVNGEVIGEEKALTKNEVELIKEESLFISRNGT